jgi:hypothetical protein
MIQPTDYKIEIEKWFEIGLNRSKINHISCISNRIKNENLTKEMVDELIKNEGKICPEILQFFNNIEDYTSSKIITQQDEIDAIRASIIKSIEEIDKLMIEALEEPGLLYELNEYFVEIYDQLGKAINEMNYHSWIGTKNPNQNLDILFLQVNGEQISYSQLNLEINYTVFQTKQLREAFEHRIHLLEQYRSYITEVYARHLMLPSKKVLPVIKYKESSKTKIAELIHAIETENKTIIDTLKFAEFLLKIFDIPRDQYKKLCYDIRNRKVRAIYTKDLKDAIETLPY